MCAVKPELQPVVLYFQHELLSQKKLTFDTCQASKGPKSTTQGRKDQRVKYRLPVEKTTHLHRSRDVAACFESPMNSHKLRLLLLLFYHEQNSCKVPLPTPKCRLHSHNLPRTIRTYQRDFPAAFNCISLVSDKCLWWLALSGQCSYLMSELPCLTHGHALKTSQCHTSALNWQKSLSGACAKPPALSGWSTFSIAQMNDSGKYSIAFSTCENLQVPHGKIAVGTPGSASQHDSEHFPRVWARLA